MSRRVVKIEAILLGLNHGKSCLLFGHQIDSEGALN
jgi:hypothetical protein